MLAIRSGAILIAALAASSAWAQAYLGMGIGQAKYRNACEGAPAGITCDSGDTGLKLFGGYAFTPNFAVEIGGSSLGTVRASTGESAELQALDLSVIGSWPIGNRVAIYARLGVYEGDTQAVSVPVPAVFPPPPQRGWMSGNNTGSTYGLGASYNMTENASLRLEWQRFADFGVGPKLDLDVFSIGALMRF
jgi:opacity protein-like surface antigen